MSDTPKDWVMALVSGRGSFAAFIKTRQHPLQYCLAICTNPVEVVLAGRVGGMAAATVWYELKTERPERKRVPKVDSKTIYR